MKIKKVRRCCEKILIFCIYLVKKPGGRFVTCTETIYSEQVLDYIVSSYIREETLVERYQPTCYSRIGGGGTIVYREENRIDSQTINNLVMAPCRTYMGLWDMKHWRLPA